MAAVPLLYGFLGSGKTAFAGKLEKTLPAVCFTCDEWTAELYGADPPAEKFAEYYQRVVRLIEKQRAQGSELGIDVVSDFGLRAEAGAMRLGQRFQNLERKASPTG